jgi:hypothetical protein
LKEEKHLSVRVAATRAWMSLVYACNEDFNQTFVFNAVVRDMIAVLSKDKSPIILDLLLQTLTALMNGHNRSKLTCPRTVQLHKGIAINVDNRSEQSISCHGVL